MVRPQSDLVRRHVRGLPNNLGLLRRWAEFSAWLEATASKTTLLNARILEWNLDKHYLQDLGAEGIGVVPTVYLSQGSTLSMTEVMARRHWDDVVVKPAIAGGAYDTYRVTKPETKPESP